MTTPAGENATPRTRPSAMSWRLRVGLRALCAALSLLVLVASGVAWATYHDFTGNVAHGDSVPGGGDADGRAQNILLLGNDTRAGATPEELKALHTGDDTTTVNADTMMVLHIPGDGDHGRPTLVSFPRDAWVEIPGNGMGKLNSAYPDAYNAARSAGKNERLSESAGIEQTIRAIQALTGLKIDHYMQVNLLGFYRISNAIGGVEVCLKNAQNKTTETDGTRRGFSGIDLPRGESVIKGKQALAFVRQRHGLPHGDLDRVKRQQYFLKAAFAKITSAGTLLNPAKISALLDAVSSSMLTDPGLDLLSLARQFQSLTAGKITFATIPNKGPKLIYPGGVATSIVEVDRAAIPAFIAQLKGEKDDAMRDAKPAAPASVSMDVLNATDVAHLAARNATGLQHLGFTVKTVGSADPAAKTTVEYPAGAEAQAKAVLAVVPKAKGVVDSDVERVTLVLGDDGAAVKGVAPATTAPKSTSSVTTGSDSGPDLSPHAANGLGCID